jgi:hypothetical protein
VLHYTIRQRPGQSVQFAEVGLGASQSLATTSAARGTLHFTPAIGPAGRRQILAIVLMGGVPTKRLVVASYKGLGPPRAQRPPHLRLARRGSELHLSWHAGAHTTRYEVVVVATDGRRLLFQRLVSTRSLAVSGFAASGATAKVFGVGPDGNMGPPAIARLPKLAAPTRVTKLSATRKGSQIHVSWRPAVRALAYRVQLEVGASRVPFDSLTTHRAVSLRIGDQRTAVRVTVQGEGALGALGAKSAVRLAPRRVRR